MRLSLLLGLCIVLCGALVANASPVVVTGTVTLGDLTVSAARSSYNSSLDELDIYATAFTGPAAGSAVNILQGTWAASSGATIAMDGTSNWANFTTAGAAAPDSFVNFDTTLDTSTWTRNGLGGAYLSFNGTWYTTTPSHNLTPVDPAPGDGFDTSLLGKMYVSKGAGVNFSGAFFFTYGDGTNENVSFSIPKVSLVPGDVNGDGTVDNTDLQVLISNYGKTGQTLSQGDVNGDGKADFADLSIVLTNFAQTTAAPAISAVPEPSTLALLGLGAISLLAYAWRRRRA